MIEKPPLMFIPLNITKKLYRFFYPISERISNLIPGIRYELLEAEIEMDRTEYFANAMINSLVVFFLFVSLVAVLQISQGKELAESLIKGTIYSSIIFFSFIFMFIRYPKILSGKRAEQIDKSLIFALKDLHLQIGSGVTLYNGLVNVAKAGYGESSKEFERVAQDISIGVATDKALEKMALRTSSEFLRRTTWQLINTIKAGASLKATLNNLIKELLVDRKSRIKSYIAELNLWILVYMFFAIVIPSIGSTLLIILSSFAGFTPSKGFFIGFIIFCLVIQLIIIGFVKTRRPVVQI